MWSEGMGSAPQIPTSLGFDSSCGTGDSNSQSYQDYNWFPTSSERGGPCARTFQWTECWRAGGMKLDLGPWVRWGRPGVAARAREWLGLERWPGSLQDDYLYNFAIPVPHART